jgi:ubiquinone/menaquinone biosynthesis C-methylase UbiE
MYHRVALGATGLESLKGRKLLDLACGRGGGLGFLVDHFQLQNGTGIDSCSRQISYAIDTFRNPDAYSKSLSFFRGDVENLPTPVTLKKYDIITCIEAWHTFPNTERILQ